MESIYDPWPWYVAGPIIALVMLLLLFFGKSFGISSNLRTMCSIAGAGKFSDFFRFDWKQNIWNLVFVVGCMLGGYISHTFLSNTESISLDENTIVFLRELGIENPGEQYAPEALFGLESLQSWNTVLYLILGGILVGFGTRYAGGCTSGHAISGLSNLQVPSLIAVIGFFIGGLAMTHLILPLIL